MKLLTERKIALLIAGMLSLLATATASAQRGAMMGQEGMESMMEDCPMMQQRAGGMRQGMGGMTDPMGMDLAGIELSPEQRAQVRELRQNHRQRHYQRMASAMNLRDDLHALMQEEMPNPEAHH